MNKTISKLEHLEKKMDLVVGNTLKIIDLMIR